VTAAALAACVVVLLALSVELRRRGELYWYDVRQDYHYAFAPGSVVRLPVELTPDGFVFPEASARWDTAALRLEVRTSWTSRWYEPSVAIEHDGQSDRQYLDRGGKGSRYLLLPPGVGPGERVRLLGNRVSWPSQRAELLLWDNALPADPTVLVLAPHPDDAEIAAFGVYAAHRSFVATVTAGNYIDNSYEHLVPDAAAVDALRARLRTWDSLAIPSMGGVPAERVVNLGYPGLSLERLHATRGEARPAALEQRPLQYRQGAVAQLLGDRTATATWDDLVQDLATLLDRTRPDIVVAPHPVLDESSDHQFTTVALFEALDRLPEDRSVLFLYTNHHILAEYYPFGPSDSRVSLPPWFDRRYPFGRIYSQELDGPHQVDKLFALDAHHDLRAAPRRLTGGPTDRFLLRLERAVGDLVRDPVSDYSYYRRAVRPNELFFVYTAGQRSALRDAIGPSGRTARVAGQR
jgi:LmbE family N-acetylglucosaminyl deacetylase